MQTTVQDPGAPNICVQATSVIPLLVMAPPA